MQFQHITAIVLRQFYLLRGSPMRVFSLYIWVAIDIILWGFISKYLNSVVPSGFNFVPAFLGAVLLSDFFARVILGVTTAFFEDVWSRNFLNIFASPLTLAEYISGLVLTGIATSATGFLVMFTLASAVFGLSLFAYGIMLVPFVLVLVLFGIGLGIFGSAIVLRFGPSSEWFVWPIPAIIAPFAGVFYPISVLPQWMQYVSHLLPPSYVFTGMRTIVSGGAVSGSALFISASLAMLYILLACWFFSLVYRQAVRTGLIARYSAESAS